MQNRHTTKKYREQNPDKFPYKWDGRFWKTEQEIKEEILRIKNQELAFIDNEIQALEEIFKRNPAKETARKIEHLKAEWRDWIDWERQYLFGH